MKISKNHITVRMNSFDPEYCLNKLPIFTQCQEQNTSTNVGNHDATKFIDFVSIFDNI